MTEPDIDLGIGSLPLAELDVSNLSTSVLPVLSDRGAQGNADRDLLNQILGQAQAAQAIQQISRTLGVSKLAYVKETKLYKALKGTKKPNCSEFFKGTWDEFCALQGISVDKADHDIANLNAFGEEALESMSRIGIGYRDMQQYRRLPDEERTALIEAAKAGDKDQFLDMAESIIERHAKEKETLQKEIADKDARLDDMENAKGKQIKRLEAELEHRDTMIEKFKNRDNRDYVFLPQTHIVREECLAYQAECEVALNSLQAVFNGELFGEQITERDLRIEQIYITANVIAARATALIERIREKSMIDLPDTIASKHMLTDDEAEHWLLDYPLIERKHEAAKAKREDARPKGPGRPKKGQ
ncbi:hypothetical protein ACH5Y9_05445 [Methylomonas sp. BW4-1]|uniref:hypothetical protein n=1 Tax=Methylomonas sp. BW4-1 TaxID=3376685 RepID=UPI004041CCDC